jgi:hypothetical protein
VALSMEFEILMIHSRKNQVSKLIDFE